VTHCLLGRRTRAYLAAQRLAFLLMPRARSAHVRLGAFEKALRALDLSTPRGERRHMGRVRSAPAAPGRPSPPSSAHVRAQTALRPRWPGLLWPAVRPWLARPRAPGGCFPLQARPAENAARRPFSGAAARCPRTWCAATTAQRPAAESRPMCSAAGASVSCAARTQHAGASARCDTGRSTHISLTCSSSILTCDCRLFTSSSSPRADASPVFRPADGSRPSARAALHQARRKRAALTSGLRQALDSRHGAGSGAESARLGKAGLRACGRRRHLRAGARGGARAGRGGRARCRARRTSATACAGDGRTRAPAAWSPLRSITALPRRTSRLAAALDITEEMNKASRNRLPAVGGGTRLLRLDDRTRADARLVSRLGSCGAQPARMALPASGSARFARLQSIGPSLTRTA
jgi:hypothetical protein